MDAIARADGFGMMIYPTAPYPRGARMVGMTVCSDRDAVPIKEPCSCQSQTYARLPRQAPSGGCEMCVHLLFEQLIRSQHDALSCLRHAGPEADGP